MQCQVARSHQFSSVATQLAEYTHHELLHADGEGRRVEQDLPVLGKEANDVLDEHHEILRQQLIRLRGDTQLKIRLKTENLHLSECFCAETKH